MVWGRYWCWLHMGIVTIRYRWWVYRIRILLFWDHVFRIVYRLCWTWVRWILTRLDVGLIAPLDRRPFWRSYWCWRLCLRGIRGRRVLRGVQELWWLLMSHHWRLIWIGSVYWRIRRSRWSSFHIGSLPIRLCLRLGVYRIDMILSFW